jgi:hypothetical protein
MCIYEGCKVYSSYNNDGENKGLYCLNHKLEGMVNVKRPVCTHQGCKKQPFYNYKGEKRLYCLTHKLDGMINVVSPSCIHEGCTKQPVFNNKGEKKTLYCTLHKLDGMIDVKNPKCVYEGCNVKPIYNIEGEKKALYCASHKLEGMLNVVSTTCIHTDCSVIPYYNYTGKKPLYCVSHKLSGMIDVKHFTCIYAGCSTRPSYNIEGETKALYCSIHRMDGMIDVQNPICKSVLCYTRVKGKYDGYCLFCYIHLFPDKQVSRNYKTKEYSVVEHIKLKYPGLSWVSDKVISGGCSKRRPDLLLDLGYQIIIIEVDENQHVSYDCSCENKRIMQLSQDLGHRPIIFIRFNPDDYTDNGVNIASCWGINSQGICTVKKNKKKEWSQRLNILEEHTSYWIDPVNKTNKTIEVIQLFYDNM